MSNHDARTRRIRREFSLQETEIHGQRVGYRMAGEGPLVVLIHGITSRSDVWLEVMEDLARDHTVVAPDLVGHGRSAKPRGDYSLGAYASGGLGQEVHPLLRAAALPGAELVLPLIANERAINAGAAVAAFLERLGFAAGPDLAEGARGYASLADADSRQAFLHTLRAVIDLGGQRVSATDRLYLAERMPTLLVWGTEDPIIPIEHGRAAAELVPNGRLVEIEGAGHWPQLDAPTRLVQELSDFIDATEPYVFDLDHMREMLRRGPEGSPARAPAGQIA